MLDPGLAHLVNELTAFPGRRWIGAGVLESGYQPDAHDLDFTALKHIGKVADGLLDLGRRWLGLLFSRGCGIGLDLRQHQRQDQAKLGTPRLPRGWIATSACLLAQRSGRTPGPVLRTETRRSIEAA